MSPTDPPLPPNDDAPPTGNGEPGDQPRDPETGAGDTPGEAEPTEVIPPVDGSEPTEVMETESPSQAMRRRVSRRRYIVRRIVVLACLLLVIGGIIGLIVWAVGGDGDGQIAIADTTEPTTPVDTSAAETTDETTPPETTDPVETTPDTTGDADTTDATTETTEPPETTDTEGTHDRDGSPPETTDDPESTTDPDDTATETTAGEITYDLDSEASCEIGQELRRGDAGPQVRCVQERLNEVRIGGEELSEDGGFGEQTDDAVQHFQEAHDLRVDGVVGPATGELLGIWPDEDE